MRITRHQMFLEMARTASKRSTCFRGNVGAIVVHDNRVISIGYNGAPAGEDHCLGNTCPMKEDGGCLKSIHAEKNALNAIPIGVFGKPLSLYCTHSPCSPCAIAILQSSISNFYYEQEYRVTLGKEELISLGVGVYRVVPSGFIVDQRTNRLVDE